MKLKNSHLIIIFIALLGVFFVVQKMNSKKKEGTLKTQFFNIDTKDVIGIKISPMLDDKNSFKIIKENGQWQVQLSNGQKVEADTTLVSQSLRLLKKIQPSRLANTKEEKWPEYGVDSIGTLVEIDDGNKTYQFILGEFVFMNNQTANTYVRLPGEKETYACEAYLETTFKAAQNQWRKKDINIIPRSNWSSIHFDSYEKSVNLDQIDGKWQCKGTTIDSLEAENIMQQLESFGRLTFSDVEAIDKFEKTAFTLGFQGKDNLTALSLSFYNKDRYYIISSSINQSNYFTADSMTVNKFVRLMEKL